jgi:hypothetical protein
MKGRLGKLILLLAGISLGQAGLYGPSLAGRKILLPLDILAQPNYYLPPNPEAGPILMHNIQLADLILWEEPSRRLLGEELRSGRFPLWNPYQYAGAPDIRPNFSPFKLLSALVASPTVIPWIELLKAIVGGLGTYFFCRRVLQVAFWPAAIASWCYPLTGFFVLWQGYPNGLGVYWLPWTLLAVDKTARGKSALAPVGLSVATWLVLVSGHLDLAGQVLLASGLFALWCLQDAYPKAWFQRQARKATLALAVGWGLGLLLAAPYILPALDYTRTGVRMARRSAGTEERPPVGLAALPQVVLPKMYGSTEMGTLPVFPKGEGGLPESTSATYAGLLATLFVAPLAWCSRRHRSMNVFWAFLGFFALSWSLNVPGLVHLLRLPGLNLMSHNRFVFAASFAVLALAAVGLDVLWQGQLQRKAWFWVPAALLGVLCAWCVFRAVCLPEPIRSQVESAVSEGQAVRWVHDLQGVRQVQGWFARMYVGGAVLCGLGLAGWLFLWFWRCSRPWFVRLLGLLMVTDLVAFGLGRAAQGDRRLYFPPIPVLQEIGRATPGRVVGFNCLPANLAAICGLHDVRGYDGVEPAELVELLASTAHPRSSIFPYAQVQWLAPNGAFAPEGYIRLPPVLDMLGVRYVIFRGSPIRKARPALQGPDYWVMVNSNALERVFIPRRIETVAERKARMEKLTSPAFDPREVAYMESPVDLPVTCRGSAEIVDEVPTRVTVSVRMETPGLVVLADRWDQGWRAYLNGKRVPILRANHAIRGVVVPAGSGTLEFRYWPASLASGLGLASLAGLALLGWVAVTAVKRRHAGAQ